jgi:hypothetical protein
VAHRVSPTGRIGGHIDELFAQVRRLPEILEAVARLGAQQLMWVAPEAEVTGFLGRDRYQRAASCRDARRGSRNGYREVTVKTTARPVAPRPSRCWQPGASQPASPPSSAWARAPASPSTHGRASYRRLTRP